jgi:hypothetical protein
MKKKWLIFELWFNLNIAPWLTNVRKMHQLQTRINNQRKELEEWQD